MKYVWARLTLSIVGGLLLGFLAIPLLALLLQTDPRSLWSALQTPFVLSALRVSAFTTTVTLLVTVALGVPLAWTLAQAQSRAARTAEALLQLPLVMPPAVAGIALLLAFGRSGYLTRALHLTTGLAFSQAAVIMAEVFVSAPYFVQGAISAFRGLDRGAILAARSLGAGPLRVLIWIALPMALRELVAAAATSWARALGEFGATLMFAGNLEGRTQTMPLAIYAALESNFQLPVALGVLMLFVAAAVLLISRALMPTSPAREGSL